jgi:hypothetical protein
MTFPVRRLAPLALVALAAGALIGADAGSGARRPAPKRARVIRVAPLAPLATAVPGAPAPFMPLRVRRGQVRLRAAFRPCRPASGPAPTAPSQQLLATFGVLRRAATAGDALPAEAAAALKARGLRVEGTGTARLLRTGPGDGKAWVVPVAEISGLVDCVAAKRPADREGLAVVALGETPAGGGGTRDDLARGRAPASVETCAGPDHRSISVSGIVPDGVSAVYLTATDGTAVRADVRDNGFALLVPAPVRPDQRFLVWTPANGTPHVQPILVTSFPSRLCGRIKRPVARVSPGPFSCTPTAPALAAPPPAIVVRSRPLRVVPGRRVRRARGRALRLLASPPVALGPLRAGCLLGG